MNDQQKQTLTGCLVTLVYLPCLIGVIVSYQFNSPLLTVGCFVLLFILPMLTYGIMRRVFGPESFRPRPADTQRYLSFIQKFTGPVALVVSSVLGGVLTLSIVIPVYRAGRCPMGKAVLACLFMAIFFPLVLWLTRVITFGTHRLMRKFQLTGEKESVQPHAGLVSSESAPSASPDEPSA